MSYEKHDASLPVIGVSAGILLFLLVASIVVADLYYRDHFGPTRGFPTAGRQTSFTQGPSEEPDVLRSWQAVQAEAARLNRYAWIDRQAGIAQIPIERAMQLLVAGARPVPFPPPSAAVRQAEAIQDRPMPRH